jgi:Putative transposase
MMYRLVGEPNPIFAVTAGSLYQTVVRFRVARIRQAACGLSKPKVMTLAADEFIRRFLKHTVPDGFHQICHIGFLRQVGTLPRSAGRTVASATSPTFLRTGHRGPFVS